MRTINKIWIGLALIIIVNALTACGTDKGSNENDPTPSTASAVKSDATAEGATFPRTIQHMKGQLTLDKAPERIASVDIMSTDYLLALDITPIVSEGFGTKEKSPIFNKYAEGKKVVDLGSKTNLETLLEMEPDLIVLGSASNKLERYEEFNKMANTVAIDFSLEPAERLMKFAELVGKEEKAKEVIADFNKLKEEATATAALHKNETVIFLISNGKDFTVIHPTNFPLLYEGVGLTPVPGLPEDGKIGGRIGIEALSDFDPDHIFIAENRRQMSADDKDGLINIWTSNPVWKNLDAIEKNQVYSVDTLVGDAFFLGQIAGLEAIKEHLGKKE